MSIRSIVLAVAASAVLPAAAQAATAFAETSVHVRAGPSTGRRIVDTLRGGERVDVDRCTRGYSWCHVTHRGADGWVAARYLNDRRYGQRRPLDRFGLSLNIPQLGLRFGVGPDGARVGPSRGNRRGDNRRRVARVCFYENFNYGGRHFCAPAGRADSSLGNFWNDRISSIRVMGGASVRVCQDVRLPRPLPRGEPRSGADRRSQQRRHLVLSRRTGRTIASRAMAATAATGATGRSPVSASMRTSTMAAGTSARPRARPTAASAISGTTASLRSGSWAAPGCVSARTSTMAAAATW